MNLYVLYSISNEDTMEHIKCWRKIIIELRNFSYMVYYQALTKLRFDFWTNI